MPPSSCRTGCCSPIQALHLVSRRSCWRNATCIPSVRLPNGVFNPYTSIKTNLLFFENGKKTQDIWFYEHPYPEGAKAYNKTKPIRIEEFDAEKKWWKKRKENEFAWKVSVKEIIDNDYNLDCKNPNTVEEGPGDPDKLLKEFQTLQGQIDKTREKLKKELASSLEGDA